MNVLIVLIAVLAMTGCASSKDMSATESGSDAGHSHDHSGHDHKRGGGHDHGHGGPSKHHSFSDAEKWSKAFDDPARDQWQKPDFVVEKLDLRRAKCIADIGAGTGYFSIRMARAVPRATVYAVDIEPNMVAHLKARGEREGLKNHKAVQSTEEFPKVIPTNCDVVLLVDTYHHIENRSVYFKKGLVHLNKRGRLAIIDFTLESPMGPKKEHRIPKHQVIAELQQLGYKLRRDIEGLPNQYFLIFESPL